MWSVKINVPGLWLSLFWRRHGDVDRRRFQVVVEVWKKWTLTLVCLWLISFVPKIHACKQQGRAQGKCNAHEVNFCQYTNSSCYLRIYFPSHLQSIRVCQIDVGASHCKNNASRFRDILVQHISNLLSISHGWSPTGTFVSPGRSARVSVRTFVE